MDLYYQGEIIIWSTQFNPGGIFYKKVNGGERRQSNSGVIVSQQCWDILHVFILEFSFLFSLKYDSFQIQKVPDNLEFQFFILVKHSISM